MSLWKWVLVMSCRRAASFEARAFLAQTNRPARCTYAILHKCLRSCGQTRRLHSHLLLLHVVHCAYARVLPSWLQSWLKAASFGNHDLSTLPQPHATAYRQAAAPALSVRVTTCSSHQLSTLQLVAALSFPVTESTTPFFYLHPRNSTTQTYMLSVTEPLSSIDILSLPGGYEISLYHSRIQTYTRLNATVTHRKRCKAQMDQGLYW
jgi:hypothetical protein